MTPFAYRAVDPRGRIVRALSEAAGLGSDVEIDIECPAGMIDGCAGQPRYSDRHVCVRP